MSTSTKARNHTIDILRLTAAFAVICLHNFSGSGVWAGETIVTLSRFAVPLFFLFSGYFQPEAQALAGSAHLHFNSSIQSGLPRFGPIPGARWSLYGSASFAGAALAS